MAISEKSVDAEQLAIEELIMQAGARQKNQAIVEDGASNWDTFREKLLN